MGRSTRARPVRRPGATRPGADRAPRAPTSPRLASSRETAWWLVTWARSSIATLRLASSAIQHRSKASPPRAMALRANGAVEWSPYAMVTILPFPHGVARRLLAERARALSARVLYAWLFLAIFLGNGAVEFAALVDWVWSAPGPRAVAAASPSAGGCGSGAPSCGMKPLFEAKEASCCSTPATPRPAPVDSCCAPPPPTPKPRACSCPLCSDHCPGGDRCRCDSHGNEPKREGLFFVAPGCHPNAIEQGASLPSSISFRFLPPSSIEATPFAVVEQTVMPCLYASTVTSWHPAPTKPPPRRAA